MALSEAQRAELATFIRNSTIPAVQAALAIRNDSELARLMNLDSATWIWRSGVPVTEIEQNGFSWASVDEVPAAKWRIWERLTAYGEIDFSKANVRQGLVDFAKDETGAQITALRDSILPYTKRQATNAEAIFATGTGTENSPADAGWTGQVSSNDVGRALNENP